MFKSKGCEVCKKSDIKLLRCSKCRSVYYCTKEHQQTDWKTHKTVCGQLEKKRIELEKKDPLIDEDINDIKTQHNIFLSNFERDKKEYGLENEKTLNSAFKLIDSYISKKKKSYLFRYLYTLHSAINTLIYTLFICL